MDPPTPPRPPDPPDPGSSNNSAMEVASSNYGKRRLDNDEEAIVSKKTIVNKEMANASIQQIYLHPNIILGIKAYKPSDKGPFRVHVSRSEPDPSAGTSIRPIKFGQFLSRNKIKNICPDGVKRVGRNKIAVEFMSAVDANNFLDNPILSLNRYEASIPSYSIMKMGIVRQIPVDWSMDEFVESLVIPSGTGEVLKARRLNRKVRENDKNIWIPTQSIVLTFHGQVLPTRVFSYHTSLPVEPYQYPTIQCLNCCRFGHVKAQCRSKPRCFRCSQPHSGETCEIGEAMASCLHCLGKHFANNVSCPEQRRQKSIKIIMSQENLSYEEASIQLPKIQKSYSDVLSVAPFSQPSLSSHISNSQSTSLSPSSYKKTVISSSHPRVPLGKSYDRDAHHSIVAEEPSVLPNGCALLSSQVSSSETTSQNDSLLELLLTMILNLISQNKNNLPSNVAQKLFELSSISSNNGSRPSMEREKPASKKA